MHIAIKGAAMLSGKHSEMDRIKFPLISAPHLIYKEYFHSVPQKCQLKLRRPTVSIRFISRQGRKWILYAK